MKNLKKVVLVLFVTAIFLLAGMGDLFARRSGGGSRSFSRPSPSRSTSRSTSTSTKSKSIKPATSKRATSAPKRSAAQQKSYEAAKKNGTAFKSKSAATAAYKSKNASKYTSKYVKQPATRPSHVPQTTKVGNVNYNVTYNVGRGGYGYTNSLGAFIMYDMMSDAIMMNRMMARDNYHYDTRPAVIVHNRNSGIFLFWVIAVVAIVALVIFFSVRSKS